MIFPAAVRYQNELASTCANLKLVGYEFDTNTLDKMTELVKSLQDSIGELEAAFAKHVDGAGGRSEAYVLDDLAGHEQGSQLRRPTGRHGG